MNKILALVFALFAALCITLPSYAQSGGTANGVANGTSGLDALSQFLRSTKTGKADFQQTVSTVKQGATKTKNSSGSFAFARPNRFRFDYEKPFNQQIIADGKTLWLYDKDLKQVTSQSQDKALANTPAAIIATASEVKSLERIFTITDAGEADGMVWVDAKPKAPDSQYKSIRIGFKDGILAVLNILDQFDQKSTVRFSNMSVNGAVPSFNFKPPEGVDVIKQ